MDNIKKDPLKQLVEYYRAIYKENPIQEITKREGEIPKSIKGKIQMKYFPEPFYGYFEEDMRNDALLLLLNPGHIDTENNVCTEDKFNDFHKKRYLNWSKADYLNESELLKQIHVNGSKWRDDRKKEINNIVCFDNYQEKVPFLHTMEFLPYHSKKFNFKSKKEMNWICELKTSQLLIKAIEHISKQRKVKYIFGIGLPWVEIFRRYGFEPVEKIEVKKSETGRFGFRVYKYKFTDNAVPVIVSILGSGAIRLPSNEYIVKQIRKMLD